MKLFLPLLAVLLLGAPSSADPIQGFNLLEITQQINNLNTVSFTGKVENSGTQIVQRPLIEIRALKESVEVGKYVGPISAIGTSRYPAWRSLEPGEQGTFDVSTPLAPSGFDDIQVELQGEDIGLDLDLLQGDLELVEGSVELERGRGNYGNIVFDCQAMFINNTNAHIDRVRIFIYLLGTDGKDVGRATWNSYPSTKEFAPSDTLHFWV